MAPLDQGTALHGRGVHTGEGGEALGGHRGNKEQDGDREQNMDGRREQRRAEWQDSARPDRAEQSRAGQGVTGQSRAERGRESQTARGEKHLQQLSNVVVPL